MIFVKICGLTREPDVEAAIEFGASAVGFVLEPSSSRFIATIDRLVELARFAKASAPNVLRVGVFGDSRRSPLAGAPQLDLLNAIQSHDETPTEWSEHDWLACPIAGRESAFPKLNGQSMLVLDAFSPQGYGGTGLSIDWDLAAEWVAASPIPVVLAGGLTPENVSDAVRKVKPFGVDVSTGVESGPGVKDHDKVKAFLEAARSA